MKKITFLLIFISFGAMGQGESGYIDKCYIDAGTKDTVLSTYWKHLFFTSPFLMNFRLVKTNSITVLELKYHFDNKEMFTVRTGDSIWVKFAGGYTMPLYADKDVTSWIGGAAIEGEPFGTATLGVCVKYTLPANKLFALAGNEIEKIRVFSSYGKNDLTIDSQYGKAVMRSAEIVLKKRKFKEKETTPAGDTW